MRWDDILEAITNVVSADATMLAVFGADMRAEVFWAEQIVPGLTYRIVVDAAGEQWEPTVVQFDMWVTSLEDLATAERGLRRLFDHAIETELDSLYCYSSVVDGASLGATIGPDRSNYFGRAVRVRIVPIREALQRVGPPFPETTLGTFDLSFDFSFDTYDEPEPI
jgi:hypothetical protein